MNENSKILKGAIVAGCGMDPKAPEGMAVMVLHIPQSEIIGKSPVDIQEDVGLPWSDGTTNGVWFSDLQTVDQN